MEAWRNMAVRKRRNLDMTHGPLLGKILLFSVPVMLTSLLQVAFNAADVIVVGQFAGYSSLAAVGSSTSTIFLFINMLVGISVGVNVLIANYVGAGDKDREISHALHTAMTVALVGGLIMGSVAIIFIPYVLHWMSTPPDVYDKALLYMRIYFSGTLFLMAYNYGTAALRAIGDTERPLFFLIISGVTNVVLNLIFVIFLKLDVAGVALATIISEALSAFLVLRCLSKETGPWRFDVRRLAIHRNALYDLCRIGVPAGIQACLFSLSNVVIQGAINTYGSLVVAACGAAANIENVMYILMNAFHQASMTFVGQNLGAGKWERVKRVVTICVSLVTCVGIMEAIAARLWAPEMIGLFNSNPDVIAYGVERLLWVTAPYFVFGIADELPCFPCLFVLAHFLGYPSYRPFKLLVLPLSQDGAPSKTQRGCDHDRCLRMLVVQKNTDPKKYCPPHEKRKSYLVWIFTDKIERLNENKLKKLVKCDKFFEIK